ncbi:hypothetical protein BSKO_11380 [Bryopsis sp. KO-2023]|nr:hypothetical protein BSKO_11380 [Bryopsis sp. KO-2023]
MGVTEGSPVSRWSTVWREARRSAACGAVLLVLYALVLLAFLRGLPTLEESEKEILKNKFLPKTLPDLVAVRDVALGYSSTNPITVAMGICMIYIMMQTFAVPGTLSLSILSGAVFGAVPGLALVTVVNAVGSSCCYSLSWCIGKPLAKALWPSRLDAFKREVENQKSHLLNYVVFLRLTPLLPNTFINVASPIVGLPLRHFFWGTFFGCIPNNSIAVTAGSRLSEMKSLNELYSPRMLLFGCFAGCVAIAPVLLKMKQSMFIKPQDPTLLSNSKED